MGKDLSYCNPLLKLFSEDSISLFKYDTVNNLLYMDKYLKASLTDHEQVFAELKTITDKLIEIDCDYSIDKDGTILLHCCNKDTCNADG